MDFSPVERQRNGGVPPEAGRGRERSEPENHRGFPAILRTAPPRHFVPLPHSANRFMGEKSSAPAAGPSNTSPPWSGSGTGEYRRRRGGGASEASQETTVDSLRSCGPRPLGTSCHSPTPLTASWGRKPRPPRNGAFKWWSAEGRQVFDVVEPDLTLGDELPVVLTCDLDTPQLTRSAPVDGRGHRHEDARGGRPEEVGGVGDADGTRHSLGHRP